MFYQDYDITEGIHQNRALYALYALYAVRCVLATTDRIS